MLRAWLRVRAATAAASSGARDASAASGAALHQHQYPSHQQPQQQQRAYAAGVGSAATATSAADDASANKSDDEAATVDYGFRQVPRADKERLVGGVFSSVAARYDTMNDLMSGGLHRLWKRTLVAELSPPPGARVLDVAGGTGDVAFRVLRALRAAEAGQGGGGRGGGGGGGGGGREEAAALATPGPGPAGAGGASNHPLAEPSPGAATTTTSGRRPRGSVVVCDINPDMLAVGRARAAADPELSRDGGLEWVEGNAERLPFADGAFDAYTVAFGIRNVTDRPAALREARRVLRPGGRLLVLELCPPRALSHRAGPASRLLPPGAGAALEAAYDAYSLGAIPKIGAAVAGDAASYRYLVESVRRFPDPDAFAALVREAGFCGVSYRLLSAGIVAIHSGFKLT
jgi:2-methoxy-6-polyprenyl-1,4-benzoquinol methylase